MGLRYESAVAFLEMLKGTSTAEVMIQTPHAPVIKLIDPEKAQATTTLTRSADNWTNRGSTGEKETQYGTS